MNDDKARTYSQLLDSFDQMARSADEMIEGAANVIERNKERLLQNQPDGWVGELDQDEAFIREMFDTIGVDSFDYYSLRGFLIGCSLGANAAGSAAVFMPHMMAYGSYLAWMLTDEGETESMVDDEELPPWPE